MAIPIFYTLVLSFTAIVLLEVIRRFQTLNATTGQAPFPKGPRSIPWLGNIHQVPARKPFLAFTTWSRSPETSSPDGLVGLRLGPSARAVVLGKWTHVRDLFDARGRGALYADRPYFPTADYVIPKPPGTDLHLVFARDGPKWRRARRTIVEFLNARELEKLKAVQDAESSQLMWEFLRFCTSDEEKTGANGLTAYHRYAMRYFGSVVLASVFGLRGKDSGPQSRVTRFFTVQSEWASMLGQGATPPLDVFPWLKYIPEILTPWKGWRTRAAFLKKRQSSLYHELFSETEARVRAGKDRESFLARLIEVQRVAVESGRGKGIYTQLELDYIGGFLMEGGADTTAMAFESFLLAMVSYPDVQKRAQEEVDGIFGPDEMPHAVGEETLPFLKACFLEVSSLRAALCASSPSCLPRLSPKTLRWRPPFPIAIPHANTADDIYQGYSIPKGTTIIPNIWAICHDPDEYDRPDVFDPQRYVKNAFGVRTDQSELARAQSADGKAGSDSAAVEAAEVSSSGRRQTYAFGAGRRVCAGSRMAENSMLMTMAKLMWSFDVVSGTREKPDVNVQTAYKDAILTGPKLFPVRFVLRDERKRQVMEQEWEMADTFLGRFE